MRRPAWLLLIVVVALAVGVWYARQRRAPTGQGGTPGDAVTTGTAVHAPDQGDGAVVQAGCEDLAAAVRTAVRTTGALPRGVRLVSISLAGDTCVIGLSQEIAGVNDLGSTGESEAQNALRTALAPFERVKSLRVTVEGVTFEGAHSGEWDAIPVRGGPEPEGADS